jgi:hypothetical protein
MEIAIRALFGRTAERWLCVVVPGAALDLRVRRGCWGLGWSTSTSPALPRAHCRENIALSAGWDVRPAVHTRSSRAAHETGRACDRPQLSERRRSDGGTTSSGLEIVTGTGGRCGTILLLDESPTGRPGSFTAKQKDACYTSRPCAWRRGGAPSMRNTHRLEEALAGLRIRVHVLRRRTGVTLTRGCGRSESAAPPHHRDAGKCAREGVRRPRFG